MLWTSGKISLISFSILLLVYLSAVGCQSSAQKPARVGKVTKSPGEGLREFFVRTDFAPFEHLESQILLMPSVQECLRKAWDEEGRLSDALLTGRITIAGQIGDLTCATRSKVLRACLLAALKEVELTGEKSGPFRIIFEAKPSSKASRGVILSPPGDGLRKFQ